MLSWQKYIFESICDKKPAESSGQDARRAGAEREEATEAGQEGEGKTSPRSSGLTAYEKTAPS